MPVDGGPPRSALRFDINVIRTIRFKRTPAGLIDARKRLVASLENGLVGEYDPVTATRVWSEPQIPPPEEVTAMASLPSEVEDEEMGFLDLVAQAEESMAEVSEVLTEIGSVIEQMGSLTEDSNKDLVEVRARGGGAKAALR